LTDAQLGLSNASYQYAQYRNEVHQALVTYLGAQGVTRGNKAFDVHANTYRIDADVVACFEYRLYQRNSDDSISYASGTAFLPDKGGLIFNWPQQNYDKGVAKNDATSRFYKPSVRILKRLKNEMAEAGNASCAGAPSFLLESLLYNVTDDAFQETTWVGTLHRLLVETHSMLNSDERSGNMVEVNGIKYLFRAGQPWTREGAKAFVIDALTYIHNT